MVQKLGEAGSVVIVKHEAQWHLALPRVPRAATHSRALMPDEVNALLAWIAAHPLPARPAIFRFAQETWGWSPAATDRRLAKLIRDGVLAPYPCGLRWTCYAHIPEPPRP